MSAVLDLEKAITELRKQPSQPAHTLAFIEVKSGYRVSWSLASSLILHHAVLALIVLLSFLPVRIKPSHAGELTQVIDLSIPRQSLYLPAIGGGSEGHRQGGKSDHFVAGSVAPARASEGFSYVHAQAIVSDPPRPTNPSQTLLQPALKNPPTLHDFVTLPNAVEMANASPAPKREVIVVKPLALTMPPPAAPNVELHSPKLSLPITTANDLPVLAVPKPVPAAPRSVDKPAETPVIESSELPTRGADRRTLLSLSAVPPPPDLPAKFPSAETRGQFSIASEVTVAKPQTAPGAGSAATHSPMIGVGRRTDVQAADAASPRAARLGDGTTGSPGANLAGSVAGNGAGNGTGSDEGNLSNKVGRGSGSGVGIGSGSGNSSASGAGSGTGAGSGSFPGITIQGGRYGNTGDANLQPSFAVRASYSLTIVSTGRSGGGLADYGVFSDENVYTVFVDMKENAADAAPSWTIQYAPMDPARNRPTDGSTGVKAPQAMIKPRPQIPTPLLHKYPNTLVVVSAILNSAGRLEQMSIKQTPDPDLTPSILTALGNWAFEPAVVDGHPVALKVLLGIPLI